MNAKPPDDGLPAARGALQCRVCGFCIHQQEDAGVQRILSAETGESARAEPDSQCDKKVSCVPWKPDFSLDGTIWFAAGCNPFHYSLPGYTMKLQHRREMIVDERILECCPDQQIRCRLWRAAGLPHGIPDTEGNLFFPGLRRCIQCRTDWTERDADILQQPHGILWHHSKQLQPDSHRTFLASPAGIITIVHTPVIPVCFYNRMLCAGVADIRLREGR